MTNTQMALIFVLMLLIICILLFILLHVVTSRQVMKVNKSEYLEQVFNKTRADNKSREERLAEVAIEVKRLRDESVLEIVDAEKISNDLFIVKTNVGTYVRVAVNKDFRWEFDPEKKTLGYKPYMSYNHYTTNKIYKAYQYKEEKNNKITINEPLIYKPLFY